VLYKDYITKYTNQQKILAEVKLDFKRK